MDQSLKRVDPAALERQLDVYVDLVRASPHNLVSPRAAAELRTRHVEESLELARLLPSGVRCLDIGSGAGLPGLIIAVARADIRVALLEATGKKASFLLETTQALGLEVQVHHGRAEVLGLGDEAGSFDVVTARAVAPLVKLLPLARPFLGPGGVLVAVKGGRWREEIEDASREIARGGWEVVGTPDTDPRYAPDPSRPLAPQVVMLAKLG